MFPTHAGESGAMSFQQMQETATNMVENICSIIARPVELVLRPWHGTRYFSPLVIFFSTLMMIILPAFSAMATSAMSMIPFTRYAPPMGLFGLGSLAQLYFLLSTVHSIRLYRRMMDLSLERNSTFEGGPLPFFYLLPKGGNFWFCRIVLEPALLLVLAFVLSRIFIFESGLATYLYIAALALAMKNFIGWYRAWEYIRNILDMQYAGPIIARMAEGQASDEEANTIHMASFPKNLSPDIRKATLNHLAHQLSHESAPEV